MQISSNIFQIIEAILISNILFNLNEFDKYQRMNQYKLMKIKITNRLIRIY